MADPTLSPCCTSIVNATSGSIDISEIGESETTGDFDLSFPSGDHLTGTFTAPTCAAAALPPDAGSCN